MLFSKACDPGISVQHHKHFWEVTRCHVDVQRQTCQVHQGVVLVQLCFTTSKLTTSAICNATWLVSTENSQKLLGHFNLLLQEILVSDRWPKASPSKFRKQWECKKLQSSAAAIEINEADLRGSVI